MKCTARHGMAWHGMARRHSAGVWVIVLALCFDITSERKGRTERGSIWSSIKSNGTEQNRLKGKGRQGKATVHSPTRECWNRASFIGYESLLLLVLLLLLLLSDDAESAWGVHHSNIVTIGNFIIITFIIRGGRSGPSLCACVAIYLPIYSRSHALHSVSSGWKRGRDLLFYDVLFSCVRSIVSCRAMSSSSSPCVLLSAQLAGYLVR